MNWGLDEANDDQLKLVICAPQEKKATVLQEFLNQLEGETTLLPTDRISFQQLGAFSFEQNGALILIYLQTPEEVPLMNQALSKIELQINLGTHKVIIFNEIKNDKLINSLRLRGVSEIIEPKISLKAFQHKFNKVAKLLFQSFKKAQSDRRSKKLTSQIQSAKALNKKLSDLDQKANQKQSYKVNWIAPIEHVSDFWLITNPKLVRFVIGKWFINGVGPGPHLGQWVALGESRNDEPGWIWNPRNPAEDPFHKDEGRWVFFGIMPEFSWEEKHWYFISKKPELSFYRENVLIHTKFKINQSNELDAASMSEVSKSILPLIQQTIEASIVLNQKIEIKHFEEKFKNEESKEYSHVSENDQKRERFTPDFIHRKTELKKGWKEITLEPDIHHEYQGQFSEEFKERSDLHQQSYLQTRVGLGLTSINGTAVTAMIEIQMVELRDQQVVLDVPADLVVVNDQIELEAFLFQRGIETRIKVNAAIQIMETETDPEVDIKNRRSVVVCSLNEQTSPQFHEIVLEIEKIKNELFEFFSKAKGAA